MPSSITFGFDSSALTPQAQTALDSVAKVLNQYPDTTINITGHTDDLGSDTYNQKLSEERALGVSHYLSQHNVNYARLTTQGMGEKMPKIPNADEASRAQNRRVELAIVANNNSAAAQPQSGNPQQQPYQQQGYPQQQYPQQGYPQQQQLQPQSGAKKKNKKQQNQQNQQYPETNPYQ